MIFRPTQECFMTHKDLDTCTIWKKCSKCNQLIKRTQQEKHDANTCGLTWCRVCKALVPYSHGYCTIRPFHVKKKGTSQLSNQDAEHEEDGANDISRELDLEGTSSAAQDELQAAASNSGEENEAEADPQMLFFDIESVCFLHTVYTIHMPVL